MNTRCCFLLSFCITTLNTQKRESQVLTLSFLCSLEVYAMGISSSDEERRLTEWLHQSRSACPSVPEKLRKGLSTASPTEYTCITRPTCRCTTWIYKTFVRLITRSPRR